VCEGWDFWVGFVQVCFLFNTSPFPLGSWVGKAGLLSTAEKNNINYKPVKPQTPGSVTKL
jgi:hypothetical protein